MKTRLELNLGFGINKTVVALVDATHSEVATKRVIAKQALELIRQKWEGRSDYMELFEKDYTKMVETFMRKIYDCYSADESTEYVEVAPVAKRKKKSGAIIKYVASNGKIKECEMQPYKTKVEAFKNLDLFVRKTESGTWIITEATTGFMLVESLSTKKMLEELLEMNSQKPRTIQAVNKQIVERVASHGNLNPQNTKEVVLVEKVEFNPENTAIDTQNSKSAEMIVELIKKGDRVLDYGCGTGRNIKYIKNNSDAQYVDGCDIVEQLYKEYNKHERIIKDGKSIIDKAERLQKNYYNLVLNSHVLNVIESDEIKKEVVEDIYKKLRKSGKAIIEVRTKSDVEGAKTKEKYGEGWNIKKGSSFTYQEAITKEKMLDIVSSAGFKVENHVCNSSRHIIQVVK